MRRIQPRWLIPAGLLVLLALPAPADNLVDDIISSGYWESLYTIAFAHAARSASPEQLRVLRNTIYARHGRPFRSPDLQAHFGQFEWYSTEHPFSDSDLTQYDRFLIAFIVKLEGGAWTEFLTDSDWEALVLDTGRFHSTPPPVPDTSCPCYLFEPDGSLRYNGGFGEDHGSFAGQWRMSGPVIEILASRVLEDGEFVDLEAASQQWITAGDLRDLLFPGFNDDYYDYMGFPIPAAVPLRRLRYADGVVTASRAELFYSFKLLMGN